MRNITVTRRYKWKLYPTAVQAEALHAQRIMLGDLQNACLQRCIDHNSRRPKTRFWNPETSQWERWPDMDEKQQRCLSHFDLTNEMSNLRKEFPDARTVTAVTLHRVAQRVTLSFEAFARRRTNGEQGGYPRYRPASMNNSIPLGTGTRADTWKTGWCFKQYSKLLRNWRLHIGPMTDIKDQSTWIHARGDLRDLAVDVIDYNNADIIWQDDRWWLSACVTLPARREPGVFPCAVRMNCLEYLAEVNGRPETPVGISEAMELQDQADKLQSDFDLNWPMPADKRLWRALQRERRSIPEYQEDRREISAMRARAARKRLDALHTWSAQVVARASSLTIHAPASVKSKTRSGRGDAREWGAHVDAAAKVNRNILGFAPATAISMLKYKAEEAGIECNIIDDENSEIAVGEKLVAAGKALRKTRRALKRATGEK